MKERILWIVEGALADTEMETSRTNLQVDEVSMSVLFPTDENVWELATNYSEVEIHLGSFDTMVEEDVAAVAESWVQWTTMDTSG